MFPFIPISSGVFLPTYFLIISFVYIYSSYWLFRRAIRFKVEQKYVLDVCLIIMVSGFVGARLLHVVYEHPDYYIKAPMQIFKFWQGGFVFYGGVLFATVATLGYLKIKRQKGLLWMDLMAPVVVAGYMVGRFATLLSGSGFGRPTDLPWAIVYPQGPEAPAGVLLHPTPIYSMIWSLVALVFVLWAEKKPRKGVSFQGSLLLVYGAYHGVGRLVIEQFRNDFRGQSLFGLSVSSWISVLLIIFCTVLYVIIYNKNNKNN